MTTTSFILNPASDSSVDSEYVLLRNINITIQDCRAYGGGWAVNRWIPAEEAMEDCGTFKTLKQAQAKALLLGEVVS